MKTRLLSLFRWLLVAGAALASPALHAEAIRYGVIGDSYSCGEGASLEQSWPTLLAQRLTAEGVPTDVVANPSRTGWTTRQALDAEMPIVLAARPDFVTVQIGVNDFVQGVSPEDFRWRFSTLLDRLAAILPPGRLLVVTIPDFSVTPAATGFGDASDLARGVAQFNTIIEEEARRRKAPVVDVFALSQAMRKDPGLRAADGLHPSALEYARWMEEIFPVARKLLASR